MKLSSIMLIVFGLGVLSPDSCEGYRILGVFPFNGRSHFMMFEALMKGLARKGHQVEVISAFPQKKPYPNYTDVINFPSILPAFVNNMTYETFKSWSNNIVHFVAEDLGNTICNDLEHSDIMRIIRNPPRDPPYDLVITEVFAAHCTMALGHHLKVPVIGMSSAALYPWGNGPIGNPANLAFVPNNLLNYVPPMTFWERLYNTVYTVYCDLSFQYYTRPQTDVIKKLFGENAPGIRESERSLALILTNTHPSLNGPRPVTPALIEVGGLHVQDDGAELPRDLKEWMDNSTEGFIYFTFGSMVTIESFPEETIRVFYKSLEKVAPIRVLIKIPKPEKLPPGLPKNFRTFVWVPQIKILKHKNIKAFITHGGLMGSQEAIHCSVPMIGMPLFADQFTNIDLYIKKKIAVKLDSEDITVEKMDKALNEILYNPVYRNAMSKLSRRFLDRPMNAMDTAIWWTEYVIRHGSDAMRSPALDLAWWQVALLDVYLVLLLLAAFAVVVAIAVIKFLVNIFFIMMGPKVTHSKKVK